MVNLSDGEIREIATSLPVLYGTEKGVAPHEDIRGDKESQETVTRLWKGVQEASSKSIAPRSLGDIIKGFFKALVIKIEYAFSKDDAYLKIISDSLIDKTLDVGDLNRFDKKIITQLGVKHGENLQKVEGIQDAVARAIKGAKKDIKKQIAFAKLQEAVTTPKASSIVVAEAQGKGGVASAIAQTSDAVKIEISPGLESQLASIKSKLPDGTVPERLNLKRPFATDSSDVTLYDSAVSNENYAVALATILGKYGETRKDDKLMNAFKDLKLEKQLELYARMVQLAKAGTITPTQLAPYTAFMEEAIKR